MFEFVVGVAVVVIAITVIDIFIRLRYINDNLIQLLSKLDEKGSNGKQWDDAARHLQHIREFLWVTLSEDDKEKVRSIPYLR